MLTNAQTPFALAMQFMCKYTPARVFTLLQAHTHIYISSYMCKHILIHTKHGEAIKIFHFFMDYKPLAEMPIDAKDQ